MEIRDSTFVKTNDNGTVNLIARRIKTVRVGRGQEEIITSATMDYGVTLRFQYG